MQTEPYNKEAAAAARKAIMDAWVIEMNQISDEERQRIVEANYHGADQ